jgi:hypothetical protein
LRNLETGTDLAQEKVFIVCGGNRKLRGPRRENSSFLCASPRRVGWEDDFANERGTGLRTLVDLEGGGRSGDGVFEGRCGPGVDAAKRFSRTDGFTGFRQLIDADVGIDDGVLLEASAAEIPDDFTQDPAVGT